MKILCTFSGKFGDIMWSLPTVRQISKNHGVKVDMAIMPSYKALVPMLKSQSYIAKAFPIDNWFCTGSPCGDQPWEAPLDMLEPYDQVFHLTYRNHPHGNQPLMDFIAHQQGLILDEPVVPFVETRDFEPYPQTYIAYCFNDMYKDLKDRFLECLSSNLGKSTLSTSTQITFFDSTKSEWSWARYGIKFALAFVGCRSANMVLAHGVGQKNIFVYEPHPHRHHQGSFGNTFCNVHWPEITGPLVTTPELEAERCAYHIKEWLKEKEYASIKTVAR
jgi:ADP-heptose:LPS heptosyltransferase